MALLSTAVGDVIYFRLLATAGATNLLLVTVLNPVVATLPARWSWASPFRRARSAVWR